MKILRTIFLFAIGFSYVLQANNTSADAAADKNTVQVYSLKYQVADSLLPTINSALIAGESVNAYNNELVVNASPASQNTVKELLQSLDKPLHNLMIMVRNNNTGSSTGNNTNVSGGIRTGEVYLGAGGPVYRERRGNNIQNSNDGGVVIQSNGARIQSNHETRQSSMQQEQKLRAIEGTPAWISTGQSIPYRSADQWGNATTEYKNADSGFYVTARIFDDRVQLSISTSNDKLSEDPRKQRRGIIDTEHLQTTVSGSVGDWINLGGISLQESGNSSSYNNRGSTNGSSIGDISVRVVPVD